MKGLLTVPGQSETELKRQIKEALEATGRVKLIRVQASGYRGRAKGAPPGTPDLVGYTIPGARFVALEVKLPGTPADVMRRTTDAQAEWLADARQAGALAYVITSVQAGLEVLRCNAS